MKEPAQPIKFVMRDLVYCTSCGCLYHQDKAFTLRTEVKEVNNKYYRTGFCYICQTPKKDDNAG